VPGTGQPPTVSNLPPNARPNPFDQQPSQIGPLKQRASIEAERGRLVCVFGPPGCGVTSIIECLNDAFVGTRTAILKPDFGDLEQQARGIRAEVLFVDGYPHCGKADDRGNFFGPEAVQYLYDKRLVFPGFGALVRVMNDPEILIRRGSATPAGVEAFYQGLPATEERIRLLNLPYFVIHNEPNEEGLLKAVLDLAKRASISR
jgi:energy-coupling factor transporter ATP-binding protein EcfA2